MKRTLVILALAGILAACSDTPTTPYVRPPDPPPPNYASPTIVYFNGHPATIVAGERFQLDWKVELVTEIRVDPDRGLVWTAPINPITGLQSPETHTLSLNVYPDVSKEYTLTARVFWSAANVWKTSTAKVSVIVTPRSE